MNRERLPSKICELVETFRPVDLYSSPTSKLIPWGLTEAHFVVRYYIDNENSFSNPFLSCKPKRQTC